MAHNNCVSEIGTLQVVPGFAPPAQQGQGMPGQLPGQMPGLSPSAAAPMQQVPQGHGQVTVQPSVAQMMAAQRPAAQSQQQGLPAAAAASTASAAAPVQDSWTEHTAPDGRKYYYNKATKQSSWEKPAALVAAQAVRDFDRLHWHVMVPHSLCPNAAADLCKLVVHQLIAQFRCCKITVMQKHWCCFARHYLALLPGRCQTSVSPQTSGSIANE